MLPGPRPHIDGRSQRGLGRGPKPAQSDCCQHSDIIWTHQLDAQLLSTTPFLSSEDLYKVDARHHAEGNV